MIAELRELLDAEPSSVAFAEIFAFFRRHYRVRTADYEIALEYAKQHLEVWDTIYRTQHVGAGLCNKILHRPYWSLVRSMRVDGRIDSDCLTAIANAPTLSNLTALSVKSAWRVEHGFIAIANSPYMSNLTTLEGSMDDALLEIALSPYMSNLRQLWLRGTYIQTAQAIALARSPYMANLEHLEFSEYSRVESRGITAIVHSPYLKNLKWLAFSEGFDSEDARSLAESPNMQSLKTLRLDGSDLRCGGVQAIAASEHLAGLEHLLIADSGVEDYGAIAIAESIHMNSLNFLGLSENSVTDLGLKAILDSPNLTALTHLEISDNLLGETLDGAAILAEAQTRFNLDIK